MVCAGAGVAARTMGQFMNYAVLGLAFGAAQVLVRRGLFLQFPGYPRLLWVAFSSLGGGIGFGLAGMVASVMDERPGLLGAFLPPVAFGAVLWMVIGLAQWLVLRLSVPRAGWWVLASTVGGVLFAMVERAISSGMGGSPSAEAAPYGAITGACYGAVTGGALVWLVPDIRVTRRGWLAVIPLVVAGLLVVRMHVTREVCDAEEQAALAQIPQYGGAQPAQRTDEAGGCAFSYETLDTVEQVTTYFTEQLTAHGWTIAPHRNNSPFGGNLIARRGDLQYAIFYASNTYNTPSQPGLRLDVQVRKP